MLANGKAHGKIHKIERTCAQVFCIARNVSAGFMHRSREVAIEHDPVILSAGHELHVLGRKLAEGRRESALYILIGLAHGVDRKRYRVVFRAYLRILGLHAAYFRADPTITRPS